jgi:phosphate-selective porin OprO and OprP
MALFRYACSSLALMTAAPALAQTAPADQPITAGEAAALRAELAELRAEVSALKADKAKPAVAAPPSGPSWKGAPQFADAATGFSFKPKGQIQVDAGYVSVPGSGASGTVGPLSLAFGAGGINTNNLGFNTRLRRVNVGAEGSLPGGFGYSFEFELSQGSVGYEDIVLTYQGKNSPLQVKIGHQYPLQSLDQMTSSKFTSFLERAGNTDAFGYSRRTGVTLTFAKQDVTLAGGIYSEDAANTNFARTGWQASARGTWSPKMGDLQAHLGLNVQHRVAPRDAQNVRLRQRPYNQITDQRFIDTGRIAGDGDDIFGVELGGTLKSLHVAGEAQWLKVRGFNDPTRTFGANNGTGGAAAFLLGDPTFFSGYAEIGYFLTGETRGYKGGRWDRTKVLHPFDKGGWGAVQLNARIDHSNLQDRVGPGAIAPGSLNFANGGRQTGFEASLIWLPTDYLKFIAQYGHINVSGGPGAVAAFTSITPSFNDRRYSSDVMAVRAQVDF